MSRVIEKQAYILRNHIYVTECHNFFLSLSYLCLATSFILTSPNLERLKSAIGIF